MAAATKEAPAKNGNASQERPASNLPAIAAERLPYHPAIQERFDIDRSQWRALVEAVFPLAQTIDSIILALSYCRARKLDPFKKNVHIVPIWSSTARRCARLMSVLSSAPVDRAVTTSPWMPAMLSLRRWSNAGIASPGGYLMLNTLEYHNAGVECSLSDVLEVQGEHLRKYSLSAKAASGILRRANRRGKTLPERLQVALESVAENS